MTTRMEIKAGLWLGLACALPLGETAAAQVRFSVTDTSSLIGQLTPSGAGPVEGTDVLRPTTPEEMPELGALSLPEITQAGPTGELDALSYGDDALITGPMLPNCSVWFSVGVGAQGLPGMPPLIPTVSSETPGGGVNEAVADIFTDRGFIGMLPAAPLGPAGPSRHIGLIDGDGLAGVSGATTPGFGVAEPFAGGGGGDDVDAFDAVHDSSYDDANFWFSIDQPSAALAGFSAADVLIGRPSNPAVYAPAFMLGLSATLDDVDALAVWEDGDQIYEPVMETFGYGQDADMILFSVRAGSDVVGRIDSLQGLQITPGDVLAPPLAAGQRPRIMIAAERLGLQTLRINAPSNDELDALDLSFTPLFDCDASGTEDACDIAAGLVPDADQNGVIDDCGTTLATYCTGTLHGGGCVAQVGWSGTPTLTGPDDFVIDATDVLNSVPGLMFWGLAPAALPFQGGILCVQPPLKRMPIQFSAGNLPPAVDCSGSFTQDLKQSDLTALGIVAGDDIYAQYWFRDSSQPFNIAFSNALQASILP